MQRSPRQRTLYILSIGFAAAPIVFALVAATSRRHDVRMAWMALASLLGAAAVMLIGRARRRQPRGVLALSALALVAATLPAGWTAYRLGARAAPGIWLVALVLGLCWVASFALDALSRPRAA